MKMKPPSDFSGGGFVLELGGCAFLAFVDGIKILCPGFAYGKEPFTRYGPAVVSYQYGTAHAVAFNGLHAADGSHFFPRVAQHALVPQGGVAYAHPAVHKTAHICKQMDGVHNGTPHRAGCWADGGAWR